MKLRLLSAFLAPLTSSAIDLPHLQVEAGPHNRIAAIVEIEKPATVPPNPALEAPDRSIFPLQESDGGKLVFVLPYLEHDQSVELKLVSLPNPSPSVAIATERPGAIDFSSGGKPVVTYQAAVKSDLPEKLDPAFQRGGYLHPLITPSGQTVTDDYPANHLHHHGVWTAWTKAVFEGRQTDFWNMGQKKGRVESLKVDKFWSGTVHAGLIAHHRQVDLTSGEPKPAIEEAWHVHVRAIPDAVKPYHLVDLEIEQTVSGNSVLELPEYHYGGLGLRGSGLWDGKDNARFLTSEGADKREVANGKPARWIYLGGDLAGGQAGIGLLCHPANFRSPQPVRVHPTEPFISAAPQIAGDMSIKPGETYRASYRLVISDGPPEAAVLERLWNDYATPPSARWKE